MVGSWVLIGDSWAWNTGEIMYLYSSMAGSVTGMIYVFLVYIHIYILCKGIAM